MKHLIRSQGWYVVNLGWKPSCLTCLSQVFLWRVGVLGEAQRALKKKKGNNADGTSPNLFNVYLRKMLPIFLSLLLFLWGNLILGGGNPSLKTTESQLYVRSPEAPTQEMGACPARGPRPRLADCCLSSVPLTGIQTCACAYVCTYPLLINCCLMHGCSCLVTEQNLQIVSFFYGS